MPDHTLPALFGVLFTLVLASFLATGCSSMINPDSDRFGDAGQIARMDAAVARPDSGSCAAGWILCGAVCVDPTTDRAHCGGCGRVCGSGASCISGTCACPPGSPSCSVTLGDPDRCGGSTCRAEQVCTSDRCVCRPGLTEVAGRCVDLASDPDNCGSPGHRCPGACAGGVCVDGCPDGTTRCDGACVNLRTNALHCGECGRTCDRDRVCVEGGCRDYRATSSCDGCGGDFPRCCDYAGGQICVDAQGCPAG